MPRINFLTQNQEYASISCNTNSKKHSIDLGISLKVFVLILFLTINLPTIKCEESEQSDIENTSQYEEEQQPQEQSHENSFESLILSYAEQTPIPKTIRQKYLYIYHPKIAECLQQIGDDFVPYVEAFTRIPMSLASYGLWGGLTKVILASKLMKVGFFGLMKTIGISAVSGIALPATLTVAGGTFLYSYMSQREIKQKCEAMLDEAEGMILKEELQLLEKVKRLEEQIYEELEVGDDLNMKIKVSLRRIENKMWLIQELSIQSEMLRNHFEVYEKLFEDLY